MPSRRTNNFPECGCGLGNVTLQFLAVRSAILATAWLLVIIPIVSFYPTVLTVALLVQCCVCLSFVVCDVMYCG